jgi:acyl-CoA thioester hydrolase
MMDVDYRFDLEFIVRDYECDLLGVVNNAVYQHYLEHARHEFMHASGIDFAKLHEEGIDPIVVRVELDYKFPLRSRDKFVVRIAVQREGRLRFVFYQDVFRQPDGQLILNGKVTAVCLQNGRPVVPDKVAGVLEKYNIE